MFKFFIIFMISLGIFYLVIYPPLYHYNFKICEKSNYYNDSYCKHLLGSFFVGIILITSAIVVRNVLEN